MSETRQEPPEPRGMRMIVVAPLILFVGLAIVFGFSLKSADPSKLPSALIGKPVPAIDFPALADVEVKGKPVPGVTAEDLSGGGVTVVNFWASWCGPCVQEHPLLVELARRGVKVVGVNYKDPAPGGRRFLDKYGNPYAAIGTDASGRGAIEWGVYGMPETFVIDGKGRIAHKHVGAITEQSLAETLMPAIEAAGR